jgi:hypothetical protein
MPFGSVPRPNDTRELDAYPHSDDTYPGLR